MSYSEDLLKKMELRTQQWIEYTKSQHDLKIKENMNAYHTLDEKFMITSHDLEMALHRLTEIERNRQSTGDLIQQL